MGFTLSVILGCSLLSVEPPGRASDWTDAPARKAAAADQSERLGPFAAAPVIPSDVRALVRIENARDLRLELASRPIAGVLESLPGDGTLQKAWGALAQDLNKDRGSLFDACFGRDVTYVGRASGEWAVITRADAGLVRSLLRTLRARVLEPQHGFAVTHLPEQDVVLATDASMLIIGPAKSDELFSQILQRWAGKNDAHAADRLNESQDFRERMAELDCRDSRADIAAFVRHDLPLGGCSMIVADVRGDDVSIRHSAKFANPPFSAPVTRLECDFSPLNALADRSLIAVMQPSDTGDGPIDSYLSAGLGAGLISPAMRQNLADRRMLVVGEADARQMPQAEDLLTTTFVACLELRESEGAARQLDQQMEVIAARLNTLGEGAFLIGMPNITGIPDSQPRQADLGAAEGWFTGGFPVMRTVSLNWSVVESSAGNWFVVGSHPNALRDAIDALGRGVQSDHRLVGRYDNCGVANGQRLGRHVESWRDEAARFAAEPDLHRVRSTLSTFASLSMGLADVRWQMARPTPTSLRMNIQAKLAPAPSEDR